MISRLEFGAGRFATTGMSLNHDVNQSCRMRRLRERVHAATDKMQSYRSSDARLAVIVGHTIGERLALFCPHHPLMSRTSYAIAPY